MKIAIGNLQSQDLLAEIDTSTGENIVGGDSIEASFRAFGSSNNSQGQASGNVFGFGNNLLANITAEVQTGEGFSRSRSFANITSN